MLPTYVDQVVQPLKKYLILMNRKVSLSQSVSGSSSNRRITIVQSHEIDGLRTKNRNQQLFAKLYETQSYSFYYCHFEKPGFINNTNIMNFSTLLIK